MKPLKARKKPVEIEFIRWDVTDRTAIDLLEWGCSIKLPYARNGELIIQTLEDGSDGIAIHVASRGDVIIKGVNGEFYPVKREIFNLTYDIV